jgi:hypothetical protein
MPPQAYAISYAAAITQKLTQKNTEWKQMEDACEAKQSIDQSCAQQAFGAAMDFCGIEAGRFQKKAGGSQWFNIGTILVASVATALGASSLASAKVWGVFGGTTGIGALASATNSETVNFESDLASISKDMSDLFTFATTLTGNPPTAPTALAVYQKAVETIGLCKAVGNTSPAATPAK